jgi:hypothetical protein
MNNHQPIDAAYIPGAYFQHLLAQEYYRRWDGLAEAAIRPKYLDAVRKFCAFELGWEAFYDAIDGKTLGELVRPEFSASLYTGETTYCRALQDAQAYRWRSVTPLRSYFGGSDEVTPVYIAHLQEKTQEVLGGAATETLYAGDDADHRAIFVYGVINQKPWFDSLVAAG